MPIKTTIETIMNRLFPMLAAFIYSLKTIEPFTFSLLKSLLIALIVKLMLFVFENEISKIALKLRLLIIKIKKYARRND